MKGVKQASPTSQSIRTLRLLRIWATLRLLIDSFPLFFHTAELFTPLPPRLEARKHSTAAARLAKKPKKRNAEAKLKKNEKLNLLRLGSRIDAVSSKVQTAVTMRQVTGSMANVVRGMDSAMKSMDLEKISAVMDRFETQFEDLDVATGYYENATSNSTAVATPQEDVDKLMSQVADEAGVELSQEMAGATPAKGIAAAPEEEREDKLGERLRALRA
ncbi:Vacuolar-sorting protein SNF7 [Friedmanniomyces endolithicus]|uniref:Vacuolar-sorting protein SNF7 n=1 Tax=Friedmanniomyces endolithicus TaxID=329885 RepID=A0AAN6KEK4_9PEZI|nr:Vacuolar-sorting protein SNF7 [Friedmanniomyces endolithicus]KAK0978723.1 Vacuolar-sorting protein SNF7 [Friedmanniomyces endolithicus]KAK1026431.1 Vacuolar-sorting protein SNF7 [Friedmanniomyces endolithicus]